MQVKVPALADSLGVGRLAALRLDCRGCELALGRDVQGYGSGDFLSRVDQLSVRVHMGRLWAPGKQQALDFGRLAFLLRRESLQVRLAGPKTHRRKACIIAVVRMHVCMPRITSQKTWKTRTHVILGWAACDRTSFSPVTWSGYHAVIMLHCFLDSTPIPVWRRLVKWDEGAGQCQVCPSSSLDGRVDPVWAREASKVH